MGVKSLLLCYAALFASANVITKREPGQTLTVAASGGNQSSPLLWGSLFEDLYHSGDGGLYGELIRNRAFQGGSYNGQPSATRSTQFWHPIGNVQLAVETTTPYLSASLPWSMKVTVPSGTTGPVGFYNDGFYGMNVDTSKRYTGSFNIRGAYSGSVNVGFRNTLSNYRLSNNSIKVTSQAGAWRQIDLPTFQPSSTPGNPNNTFEFVFDGAALAGKSINVNLLSLFKQTFNNRYNGVREDLGMVFQEMETSWIRLPGGNNMQGSSIGNEFRFNETFGDLKTRPGRLGTWTDIDTSGFGMLEQLQMASDLGQEVFLGIFTGLYIGGTVIPQNQLQKYVDLAMNQLEFLLGDGQSTTWGKVRSSLGHPNPFAIKYVEIGNEDFFGEPSYSDYRFSAFYDPIRAKYPNLILLSTVSPAPQSYGEKQGVWADEHIYLNEDNMVQQYTRYDSHDRTLPVIVGEYATINYGSQEGQSGAQSMGMALSEAIMLLGAEKNSDIVKGTAYGALIKAYDEEPGTVATIKHTGNAILKTTSFYVQKLFAQNRGDVILPVVSQGGSGVGPVYWSATKTNGGKNILKLVNWNGSGSAIYVVFLGSHSSTAQVITYTAPNCGSTNNLPEMGGETTTVKTTILQEQNGKFAVYFGNPCEIKIITA